MKKPIVLLIAVVIGLAALAACNNPETTPLLESATPAMASPSPSVRPTATPTLAPTVSAGPIQTPDPDAPLDDTLVTDFKELDAVSSTIIRGQFVKKLPDVYNALRSADDGSEGDPGIFIEQEQYEFKITEIYKKHKADTFKVGDTIIVNTPLNDRYFIGQKPKKDKQYLDMNIDEDTVLFLERFDYNPDRPAYYTDANIYVFTVKSGKLHARCYDEKLLSGWHVDEGIPIANMKKDLGIN